MRAGAVSRALVAASLCASAALLLSAPPSSAQLGGGGAALPADCRSYVFGEQPSPEPCVAAVKDTQPPPVLCPPGTVGVPPTCVSVVGPTLEPCGFDQVGVQPFCVTAGGRCYGDEVGVYPACVTPPASPCVSDPFGCIPSVTLDPCPPGQVGTPPFCVTAGGSCYPPEVGLQPACAAPPSSPCVSDPFGCIPSVTLDPCPTGQVGTPPFCVTAGGSCYGDQVGVQPVCATPPGPPTPCPSGTVGVPPTCVSVVGPTLEPCGFDQVGIQPFCVTAGGRCYGDQVGVQPFCATPPGPPTPCSSGTVGVQPTCVTPPDPPTPCPSGTVGVQPSCTPVPHPCSVTGGTPSPTNPYCLPSPPQPCPLGHVGVQPSCTTPPTVTPCPNGTVGVQPSCTPVPHPCSVTGGTPSPTNPYCLPSPPQPCPVGQVGVQPSCTPTPAPPQEICLVGNLYCVDVPPPPSATNPEECKAPFVTNDPRACAEALVVRAYPAVCNEDGVVRPERCDSDGDGVNNADDECPHEAGVRPHGCPDTDGDGIRDSQDRCDTQPGPGPSGCPDRDGDGVPDRDDACPDERGPVPTGCPAASPPSSSEPPRWSYEPAQKTDDSDSGEVSEDAYGQEPAGTCAGNPDPEIENYCGEGMETNASATLVSSESGLRSAQPSPLVLLDPSGSAARRADALGYGISDQNGHTSFYHPRFQELALRRARVIVPWNVVMKDCPSNPRCVPHPESNLAHFDRWMAAARANHLEPLVSFEHTAEARPGVLPSVVNQYRPAVLAFRTRFPDVRLFTAWNEPNHSTQPTYQQPRVAGRYWRELSRQCSRAECVVAAGDFLDLKSFGNKAFAKKDGSPGTYLEVYREGMGEGSDFKPRAWAIHPYGVAKTRNRAKLRALLKATAPSGADYYEKGPRIWITEVGGIVAFKPTSGAAETVNGEVEAEDRLRYVITNAPPLSERITRMYFYQWQGNENFDSGLSDFRRPPGCGPPANPCEVRDRRDEAAGRGNLYGAVKEQTATGQ